jgi:hypothetical protein
MRAIAFDAEGFACFGASLSGRAGAVRKAGNVSQNSGNDRAGTLFLSATPSGAIAAEPKKLSHKAEGRTGKRHKAFVPSPGPDIRRGNRNSSL